MGKQEEHMCVEGIGRSNKTTSIIGMPHIMQKLKTQAAIK
jgi:hypothetical protein